MTAQTAADIIRLLALEPHPEGGHYRETFRDRPDGDTSPGACSRSAAESGPVSP